MPTAKPSAPTDNFESLIGELDALVTAMEGGQLPLEEALDKYQRGVELIKQCQVRLDTAEQRIKVLEGEDLQPFAPAGDK